MRASLARLSFVVALLAAGSAWSRPNAMRRFRRKMTTYKKKNSSLISFRRQARTPQSSHPLLPLNRIAVLLPIFYATACNRYMSFADLWINMSSREPFLPTSFPLYRPIVPEASLRG